MLRSWLKISAACLAAAAFACVLAACGGEIRRRVRFYVVCADAGPAAVMAAGGAGYELCWRGNNYIAAACFPFVGDAENYAAGMSARGIECSVRECERISFSLTTYHASQNAAEYENAIDLLCSACADIGGIAACMESGGDAAEARAGLAKTTDAFVAMLGGAGDCFTAPLAKLSYLASDCAYSDVLLAREVRFLQLAVADVLLNITLS